MKKVLVVLCLILSLTAIGYFYSIQKNQIKADKNAIKTKTEKKVFSFLKNQKYKVIEFNDKGYFQYKLTEEMLKKEPTSKIWSFNKNAKDYIGKDIEEHYAVVANHPLQKKYLDKRIRLTILKSEGRIIGGIATVEPEYNTMFNLDGSNIN
jgi:lipopolysaccharide export system protein LptC